MSDHPILFSASMARKCCVCGLPLAWSNTTEVCSARCLKLLWQRAPKSPGSVKILVTEKR